MAADQSSVQNDIENILKEVAKGKGILNYELKPNLNVNVGDGFVSHFYRGDIINKDNGEIINVAIKKAPNWEWDYNTIFRNEIHFYTAIIPALQELQQDIGPSNLLFDNTPEYLASAIENKKEFIALEDLKTKGYMLHNKKKCLDKEQLEFIFRIYGKFHAFSFVLRKKNFEKYQQIHKQYTDLFPLFVQEDASKGMFKSAISAAVDSLDLESAAYDEVKDFPPNITATLLKSFAYDGNYRCSTHGDCWSNNMLFKYSESGKLEDIKLIDFQLARDGTPVHDLSYFFYSGAGKSDIDVLENYLKIYHNSLSEVIKSFGEDPEEIFPFDVLIKEWKENALMGVMLGIYLWQIKLLSKDEYEDKLKDNGEKKSKEANEEIAQVFLDLMNAVNKSEAFRERARDLLIHAVEYGVLKKEQIVYQDK